MLRFEEGVVQRAGLRDLDGFSHLHLICHLDRSVAQDLEVVPYLDDTAHDVCTR